MWNKSKILHLQHFNPLLHYNAFQHIEIQIYYVFGSNLLKIEHILFSIIVFAKVSKLYFNFSWFFLQCCLKIENDVMI